jgi:hypothetical protein
LFATRTANWRCLTAAFGEREDPLRRGTFMSKRK